MLLSPCFISSAAMNSHAKFLTDIGRTPGVPPVIASGLDGKVLAAYILWKKDEYKRSDDNYVHFNEK